MAKAAGAEPKRLSCTVCRLTTQVVALGHANVVGEDSRLSFFDDRHFILADLPVKNNSPSKQCDTASEVPPRTCPSVQVGT